MFNNDDYRYMSKPKKDYEIHNLFPTPVYYLNCIDNVINVNEEIMKIIPNINFKMKKENTHYLSSLISSYDPSFRSMLIFP